MGLKLTFFTVYAVRKLLWCMYMRKSRKGDGAAPAALASRAMQVAMATRRRLDGECKRYDYVINNSLRFFSIDAELFLTSIAQGIGNDKRTGRSVRLCSSYLHGRLYTNSTTEGGFFMVRIMVIRDKASNGVKPLDAQILQGGSGDLLSPLNSDYFGNRLELVTSIKQELYVGGKPAVWIDELKLLDFNAVWSGTTADQVDAVSGHLYFYGVGLPVTGSILDDVRFDGIHRTVYVDN